MFSILLRLKRQIRRLLKAQTESRQTVAVSKASRAIKIGLLITFSVLFGLLYPGDALFDPLDVPRAGEFAPEDIIAPVPITLLKSERELENEKEMIVFSLQQILEADSSIEQATMSTLSRFVTLADRLRQDSISDSTVEESLQDSLSSVFPTLSRAAVRATILEPVDFNKLDSVLRSIYEKDIYGVGVLRSLGSLPKHRNRSVIIRRNNREMIVQRSRLLDLPLANARLLTSLNRIAARDSIDVEYYYLIGRNFIQPNLWVNHEEYQRRLKSELAEISTVKEMVNSGDIIVSARQKVTERQELILRELARIQRAKTAVQNRFAIFLPVLARVLLVLAAFGAMYMFLYYFRRQIYNSNPKLAALFLIFSLQLLVLLPFDRLAFDSIYVYPLALLPIMVTILFDAEVGILMTIILALFLGVMHRFSFTVTLLTAVVGMVACFASSSVRKRTDFYRIMFHVLIAYLIFVFVVENLKLSPSSDVWYDLAYGAGNALITVLLAIGILPVIESLFGITTNITLLELSDLNHPLLKRLAIEAPGTYHHSLLVGSLSESAAEAIGANPLLARVGAYYHDIGKIEIPEYFVENQLSVRSRHEDLTPTMSSLILSSHVKKGRMLGEEADIPDDVLNFIEEHHGTMVMKYFYNKAVEMGDSNLDINKFRYPGPRPQTRETGISMLADAVEAASRTLDDPKPARIDNLIQRIINDRFQSGELDECPLTLKDLANIKQSFAKFLMAAFHHRVKYPTKEPIEAR